MSQEPRIVALKKSAAARVCLVGPRYVGVTSTLSRLSVHGYKVVHAEDQPDNCTFDGEYFTTLVSAWQSLSGDSAVIVTDVSPWAYLRVHVLSLPPEVRA